MASASSIMKRWEYDVFLSFRGFDTRKNFTSHLYTALRKEGINVFMDKHLKRGAKISSALFQVIESSQISIIIFSQNYASSKFCLDELVKILECKVFRGQIVLPVFCKMDLLEAENETGSYWQSLFTHEAKLKGFKRFFYGEETIKEEMEKLQRWKSALVEAADLSGWDLHNRNEAQIIQEIVEDVLQKLHREKSEASNSLVGSQGTRVLVKFKLKNKLEVLGRKLRDLQSIEDDIIEQLKAAAISGKKRKNEVGNWLENVVRIKEECQSIQRGFQEAGGSIELADRVDNSIEQVTELIHQEDRFAGGLVFHGPQTEGEVLPEKRLMGKGFESNMKLIRAWLTVDGVSSIGIHGMGGVGKTTLVIHIHNKFLEEPKVFSQVYWVSLSQDFSIYKLQNLIAKAIGLEFGTEDDTMRRAARLSKVLLLRGTFILILDDLWNHFDMEKVGIPIKSDGCKLIVTTRSLDVCTRMGLQKTMKIEPLSKEEAWYLFAETLGHDLVMDVEVIAKSIARECDGLPLGIVTMAGSMRGADDVREWSNALTELQKSEDRPEDMRDEVFQILKFSYTHLNNWSLQQCFLYCALFPEDYEIDREELIELLISEGIIERGMSRQKDFDKGHSLLNKLVKVSLLEGVKKRGGTRYVKMHDLIRDMAIQITKESFPSIIEAGRLLKDLPEEKHWIKETVRVSLMSNDITETPSNYSPMCPSLSTLFLSRNKKLRSILDSFFYQLHTLKVLDLSYTAIRKVPESVGQLENLKALLLRRCANLNDMPSLVKLVSLEVLDLLFCKALEEVPEGLELLSNLKFLNLFGTRLKKLPVGMLTRVSHLQFLALNRRFPASLGVKPEDLAELQRLECLYWCFHDFGEFNEYVQLVSRMRRGRQLISYLLSVGLYPPNAIYGPSTREVVFLKCAISRSLLLQKDIQTLRIQFVSIYDGSGLCFKTATEVNCSETEMKSLCIEYCKGIEYLFDVSSSPSILGNPETLELNSLPELGELFGGEVPTPPMALPSPTTFSCLKRFKIWKCPTMRMLFPANLLLNFQNLKEIYVRDCSEMEELIATAEPEASNCYNHSLLINQLSIPMLKSLALVQLPKLKSICSAQIICSSLRQVIISDCKQLKDILISLPLPALRTLRVWPKEWWESVHWGYPNQKSVLLPEYDW